MNTWLTRYVKPCASGQPGANQCPHPPVCATRTWTPKPAAGIKASLGVTMAPNQKASEKGQLEPRGGIKGTEVDGKHTQPLWDGVLLFPEDTAKRHQAEATLYTEPIRERWGPGGSPHSPSFSKAVAFPLSRSWSSFFLDVQLFLHPMEWLCYPLEYQHPWSMIRTTTEFLPPLDVTQPNCCWIYLSFLSWPKGAWLLFSLSTCVNLICGVFG